MSLELASLSGSKITAVVGRALLLAVILAAPSPAKADPMNAEIFYTKFNNTPLNVKKVGLDFDGATSFTMGTPVGLATLPFLKSNTK